MRNFFLILAVFLLVSPVDAPAAPVSAPSKKVEVFVTGWCGYCKKLESFLKNHQIEYTRYDVEHSEDGAEIFHQIGGQGVPVIRVGKEVIHGYDPDAVLAALQ